MIPILSIDATREAERLADEGGISYAEMMERAGRAVAERALAVLRRLPDPSQAWVTVLVGPGNNGGDGLVAGRIIAQESGALVRFYLTQRRDPAVDPVFRAVQEGGWFLAYAADDTRYRLLVQLVASATLVIDALYGIGARPPLRSEAVKLLRAAGQALDRDDAGSMPTVIDPTAAYKPRTGRPFVLAVDCPSGLDCDSGAVDPHTLRADETVTFIAAKPGLLTFPGAAYVGSLIAADLGLPAALPPLKSARASVVNAADVHERLPPRPVDGHKGTYGRVLIVGGSVNYSGAPGLAARSAYQSGAGLVTVGAPAKVVAALAGQILETTWLILPDDLGVLTSDGATLLRSEASRSRALLIGPGIGREPTTRDLIAQLLTGSAGRRRPSMGFASPASRDDKTDDPLPPTVIDADGLALLGEIDAWWGTLPTETVLTPHPGEMARLCGLAVQDVQAARLSLVAEKAHTWGCVVVLKGAHTVIAAPDGQQAVLPFKTSALATAGTGDVLAGMIAALLAQQMSAFDAAVCAAYAHGLTGQIAAERLGSTRAVTAGMVIEALPAAWAALHSA